MLLDELRVPWNKQWDGGPVTAAGNEIVLPGNMRITLLSPRQDELQRLAVEWDKQRAHQRTKSDAPPASQAEAEEFTDPPALTTKRSRNLAGTKDGPVDVDTLAAKAFIGDASVANAASIAFLAEFHDKALLIGGDALDEVLIGSIQSLLTGRKQRRLRVDAFVVPHNGSARNLSRPLLELLECDRYLIATDGGKFGHPNRETIARIIMYGRATPDSRLKLVFNYRTRFTEVWDDPALKARYGYEAFYPIGPEPDAGITVHL